jgi:exonuclease SbcC
MSTGQGQASYLKCLLNSSDKRKVIALLDEVAMMDSDSLELVYLSLKELEKKDMLLAAIVVKKSDFLEINKIF